MKDNHKLAITAGGMTVMIDSKKSRHGEDEISFPEDIWIDILFRISMLSMYHLFKFRCVSKYFKELIDSDEFIQTHYDRSIKTRPNILLHHKIPCAGRSEPVVIQLDFESADCKLVEFIPYSKNEGQNSRFLGCRRGILCYQVKLSDVLEQLIFCNPLTGVSRRSATTAAEAPGSRSRHLFGYDAATDDFKVLKVTRRKPYSVDVFDCVIYSSKTDSWKTVPEYVHVGNDLKYTLTGWNMPYFSWTDAEVFVDGTNCVHMIPNKHQIFAFDFGSEKFNLVPLPKKGTLVDLELGSAGLSSVDGCLCVYTFSRADDDDDDVLKVWMMNKYGDGGSWTPLLSIPGDAIPGSLWPIGFTVNKGRPQFMFRTSYDSEKPVLYLYDVHQKQLIDTQQPYSLPRNADGVHHFLFAPSHRQL